MAKLFSVIPMIAGAAMTMAIAVIIPEPAVALSIPGLPSDVMNKVPKPIQPLIKHVSTPQGALMAIGAAAVGIWLLRSGDGGKKGTLASARWAEKKEKATARRTAIQQINERKHNGLTTWINAPKITPLSHPQEQSGKPMKRFKIAPHASTIFLPDGQRGTAVAGAPGSGKTFSVIDPMIRSVIEQGFPIVLYDFKFPGQTEGHAAYAKEMGYDVRIFAPGFQGTESCNLLDFMRNADDSETAAQIAKTLNKNFSLNGGKGGEDPFFQMSGDQLIKAVLQLAKLSAYPDFLMCQKILAIDPSELIDRVKAADISPWIRVSWDQFMSMRSSEKTSSSVAATASLMFSNFVSPDLLPCLCGESTIPLDLSGKQMLVFGMDQNRRDIIGPILATVLHMIVTRNVAKQRQDPLAVFLDELPTIALPSLVNWLNESRSAGFCGTLGFQNMAQLERAYSKEAAKAILSGCNTKVVFNPGEFESAQYFSNYLGDEEIQYKQKSRSSGKSGASQSVSDQERTKKLITPDEIVKLSPGSCILINPAYSNKQESNLPLKLKVRINKTELEKGEKARAGFKKFLAKLRKQSKLKPVTVEDIEIRATELDALIPLPSKGGQKASIKPKTNLTSTLADLMQSAAEEFDAA
jgi:type IV secretory pathway TraG/TraD family ATPase VirD4